MNISLRCLGLAGVLAVFLAGCAVKPPSAPVAPALPGEAPVPTAPVADAAPLGPALQRARSRWTPVRWSELPGFEQDDMADAWNAWLKSCERPGPTFAPLCSEVRRLSLASQDERRNWMRTRLQPYRVEPLGGARTDGLLTSYYEPLFDAVRQPRPGWGVPLYRPPPGLGRGPWFTRQQMEQLPEARAQLAGHELVWLADPLDALILQIQGSGRVRVTEPDGSQRLVRLAYAATNNHPYRSPGKWLIDKGLLRGDVTWPGIRHTLAANPQHLQGFLWSNPRMVFFREEALSALDAQFGPKGAQGVALTPGRSIAVDPQSIPYGTPVWMSSRGPVAQLDRLVMAQDTGSAITGAVRADYFAGWGEQAGEFAGRMRQPLRLWVLWPR